REREVHAALYRAASNALLTAGTEARSLGPVMELSDPLAPEAQDAPLLTAEQVEPPTLLPRMPALRVFGQSNQTFIIAEGPGGLYMIDQHAAHERILFDRLDSEAASGTVPSQPLLQPTPVSLTPAQMLALEES